MTTRKINDSSADATSTSANRVDTTSEADWHAQQVRTRRFAMLSE